MRIRFLLAVSSLLAAPSLAAGLAPLAAAVGADDARARIEGVLAVADVSGPRGAFTSEMISLADGTARFRLVREDGSTELLLAGDRVYRRAAEGGALAEAPPGLAALVRGHEVHRMLLDLDRRFRATGGADSDGCVPAVGAGGLGARVCTEAANAATGALPARIVLDGSEASGGEPVAIELSDWREILGVRLPFAVDFLHAGERHAYRYVEVLPFRLSPGAAPPEAPDTLFERLGDLASLLRAHERVMAAHRASDVELLLGDEAERSLDASRGALSDNGREAVAAMLGPYLRSIRFERYEDVAVPAVAIAADGSLGWLACQIEAAGERPRDDGPAEPVAYGFTWVELYVRTPDGFERVGNASSPTP